MEREFNYGYNNSIMAIHAKVELENVDYSFKNYEDYSIETEICGLND